MPPTGSMLPQAPMFGRIIWLDDLFAVVAHAQLRFCTRSHRQWPYCMLIRCYEPRRCRCFIIRVFESTATAYDGLAIPIIAIGRPRSFSEAIVW